MTTTLAPERTDELLTDLRRGLDLADGENPAGPLFADRYWEHEMTGSGPIYTINPDTNPSSNLWHECFEAPCCMI